MKFNITIVSKDDKVNEQFAAQIENLNFSSEFQLHVDLIKNNSDSLPSVYNRVIKQLRTDKSCDFQIFMHADVNVNLQHLLEHIVECKDKYDVMGLCGTEVLNVSQKPLNWWNGSHPTPQKRWGSVVHCEMNNHHSYFSSHSPNILDHQVACIDGLCIIFGPKALYESEVLFDEQFRYHCYDTDISLQCVMHYNLSLGVLVELSLQHYSVGKGILTEDFAQQEQLLRNKWNFN